jgi:hypothetical protein
MRAALRSVPPSLWLAGIVCASFAALTLDARSVVHPITFADELIYSNAAKRMAQGDGPAPPGGSYGYGLVFPLLAAPIYRAAPHVPDAYLLLKVANAAFFSLAAIPAYLIARRVARPSLALGVAALTVLVPARAYTTLVLTESVAFTGFLLAVLAIVRALERPSVVRQLTALAVVALAVETRRQNLVLVVALPCAVAIEAALTTRGGRAILTRAATGFLPTWLALGAVLAGIVVQSLVRGTSPFAVLGPFETLSRSYDPGDIALWLGIHLSALGLMLAVVPLVAIPFALAAALRRGAPPQSRILGAVAAPLLILVLVQVATFASTPFGLDRIHERYLFYVAPLAFCLLALWIETGLRGARWAVVVVVVVVSLLPLAVPTGRLEALGIDAPTLSALGLDPDKGGLTPFHLFAVIWSAFLALWVLLERSRRGLLLLAVVAAAFVVTDVRVHNAFAAASRDRAVLAGARAGSDADWIDRAVGERASVTALAVAAPATCGTREADRAASEAALQRGVFFNTGVEGVISVGPAPDTGLPVEYVSAGDEGALVPAPRTDTSLVVSDSRVPLAGRVIASDSPARLTLWRVDGRLRLASKAASDVRRLVCTDDPGGPSSSP